MLTSSTTDHIKVSVIIPTLNAGRQFSKLLAMLQQQSIKPHEIIVADSCSDDDTLSYAQQAGAVILSIDRSEFDHGGTRNLAASYATGNILLFMTQDVLPVDRFLIERLIAPLTEDIEDNGVAYCYARQLSDASGHPLEKLARASNYPEQSVVKGYEQIDQLGIKTFFCSNACSAIRREVFEELGGFQSPAIFNEDLFMAARCILQGMKIAYCADAQVYHTHDYSIKQQFQRFFDNGVSMRCNPWILPYTAVGKAGSSLVLHQVQGLIKQGKWYIIPRLFVESAAKLLGYKLGKSFPSLPASICRRFSMHKRIWEQIEHHEGKFINQVDKPILSGDKNSHSTEKASS